MSGILFDLEKFIERQTKREESIKTAARTVLSLRHADDVAFRAAVNVLVTEVLGPGAFDAAHSEREYPDDQNVRDMRRERDGLRHSEREVICDDGCSECGGSNCASEHRSRS